MRVGAGSVVVAVGAAIGVAVLSACGSSGAPATSGTSPMPPLSTAATPSVTPTPSVSPTASPSVSPTAAMATGAKSASCVNGWVQPAPGSDFYVQATAALDQSEGGSGYVVKSVRYFAGPLSAGGIGAIYYLDVRDPRLSSRVLLASGAGPASVAVAKTGSTGWNALDWTAKGGGASPVTLLPQLAGCLDGT